MKTMRIFYSVLIPLVVFSSSGCAKLAHLPELLTLKSYSEEKDRQTVLVEKQNKQFEQLLTVVRRGQVEKISDKKTVWKNFGEPILETRVSVDRSSYQVWLYRYSTKLFGLDKVYLYFDSKGKLSIYDYSPGGTMTPVIEVAREKK